MSVMRAAVRSAVYRLRAGRRALVFVNATGLLAAGGQCVALVLAAADFHPAWVPSLGDCMVSVVAGMPQLMPATGVLVEAQVVIIPFGWLTVVLLPAVLVPFLSGGDLHGADSLVASGSRPGYWLGCCLAVLVGCFAYWSLLAAVCAVVVLAIGGPLDLSVSAHLPDLCRFAYETLTEPPYNVTTALTVTVLVSCALALCQLALAVAFEHRIAFLAVASVLSGSIFIMSPLLPGNLMMMARSVAFVVPYRVEVEHGFLQAGIEPFPALVISTALSVGGLLAGLAVTWRKSYLGSGSR